MAVLRSSRLFLANIAVGLGVEEAPGTHDVPTQLDTMVYAVPPGHRAIMRTFTAVCKGTPAVNPAPYLHVKVWEQGAPSPIAVLFRFIRAGSTTETQDQLATWWNGQVVLNAGDNVVIYNGTGTTLDVHGSGAVMPLPQ